ncbi:MAG: cobalamin synthesis protein P47K, partial [Prevotella sp.]|nr:cobalamin synthesis protein P47K [Prevotella sp.]
LLKQANLKVAEVAGSCFCCNFNGFVDAIHSLRRDVEADVILAEPVGSCADLTATIVRPLKKFHNTEVILSPLTVLSDPARLKSILYGGNGGLHEDAAYIYRKQLEESEVILITKSDLLSDDEMEKLVSDTQACFHHTKVMTCSTLTGQGVREWFCDVANRQGEGTKILDIDYDKYAHGEAVLGWLNGTVALSGKNVYWDTLLKDIMTGLAKAVKKEHLRVGHIKVIAENGKQYAVGNITGAAPALQLRGTAGMSDNVKLIINARVETVPEHLDEIVRQVLVDAIDGQYTDEVLAWRYLQPGRPNPTHRMV